MCLGQASGTAAHLCLEKDVQPREVPVEELQKLLMEKGQVLDFYSN
jgi:hypothetical protein